MPRRVRLSIPGIPWHIIQRGNNRTACFYADEDYRRYLYTLGEMAARFDRRACLRAHDEPRAPAAHPDAREQRGAADETPRERYVQYVNRCYRRSGTLWEGRFRSCRAESEEYVLACYRYIELTRCGPPWSRIPARIAGRATAPMPRAGHVHPLLSPHPEYLRLGHDDAERRDVYPGALPCTPRARANCRDSQRDEWKLRARPRALPS